MLSTPALLKNWGIVFLAVAPRPAFSSNHTPQSVGRKLTTLRERCVRIAEVEGSIPFESTIEMTTPMGVVISIDTARKINILGRKEFALRQEFCCAKILVRRKRAAPPCGTPIGSAVLSTQDKVWAAAERSAAAFLFYPQCSGENHQKRSFTMKCRAQEHAEERMEKRILLLSFLTGVGFVIVELIYAIYSHSQSTLMDALYDAAELIFIILLLFLTPLFHQPISEKHPYGFFQLESVFLVIKNIMLLSMTASVLTSVIEKLLSGGNNINKGQVSFFQLILGLTSLLILLVMKAMSRNISSPTVDAEILGWKLDVGYSLGMSLAFFVAVQLKDTALGFLTPYFDQIVAILVMLFMLPETIKLLVGTFRDLFLFSPDQETVDRIKALSGEVLEDHGFAPVFYDISKTGRKLWVAIYFRVAGDTVSVHSIQEADRQLNDRISAEFPEAFCEIILDNGTLEAVVPSEEA